MYNPDPEHSNPSRIKIPHHLCNRRKQSSTRTNPSEYSHQFYYERSNTNPNYLDQMSDENRGLRHQLEELKRFNMELRRKLEGREKQLQETDRQFKQALQNHNRRLQATNSQMASLLMQDSREYHREKQKSRSRSKSKLLAIKKELRGMNIGEDRVGSPAKSSFRNYQGS